MDDELDGFLDLLPGLRLPRPRPEEPEHGDPIEGFLQTLETPVQVCPPNDVEGYLQKLREIVPETPEVTLRQLVQESCQEYLDNLLGPMSKRARFVRDAILRDGSITGAAIKAKYTNDTMCTCDLEYAGVLLKKVVETYEGKRTTRYSFDPTALREKLESRAYLPPRLRDQLFSDHNSVCPFCQKVHDKRTLQTDHRVPYVIAGNALVRAEGLGAWLPICPSHNTAKQQACLSCPNIQTRDLATCRSCFWASPSNYVHIATKPHRTLTLLAETREDVEVLQQLEAVVRDKGIQALRCR